MNGAFHPGDICIGQNFKYSTRLNGMKCEVLTELMHKEGVNNITGTTASGDYHRVQFADGYVTLVRPERLKKIDGGEWAILAVCNLIADALVAL